VRQTKSAFVSSIGNSIAVEVLEGFITLKSSGIAFTIRLLLFSVIISFAACNRSEKVSAKLFVSPEDAGDALQAAAKSGDQNQLLEIFGPDSREIIFSGDPVQDKTAARDFTAGYGVMHRWRKMADGAQVLMVGADNFSFPIPLK